MWCWDASREKDGEKAGGLLGEQAGEKEWAGWVGLEWKGRERLGWVFKLHDFSFEIHSHQAKTMQPNMMNKHLL